jgi:hypothetical protein
MTTMIAAGVMALTATAMAEPYSDAENNFRVVIPDGWQNDHDTDKSLKLSLVSPRFDETFAKCAVFVGDSPETRGQSQADLDADGDKEIGDDFWTQGAKSADGLDSITIDGRGVRMINAHKAYFAITTLSGKRKDGSVVSLKTQQMLEAIPGQFFLLACAASKDGFEKEQPDFDAFMNSFAPLGDARVASAPSSGVTSLTMYTQPRFGGVSRVITQDQANLALFGWHGTTASMSIAGSGAWEVCDGTNFTGRCETVTAALPTGPSGKGFAIASARHVKALLPPQATRVDPRALMAQMVRRALAQ